MPDVRLATAYGDKICAAVDLAVAGSLTASAAAEEEPVKEYVVVFAEAGSLGLHFGSDTPAGAPLIKLVKPNTQASAHTELRNGLMLISVNGERIVDFHDAMTKIKAAGRPLTLVLRTQPKPCDVLEDENSLADLQLQRALSSTASETGGSQWQWQLKEAADTSEEGSIGVTEDDWEHWERTYGRPLSPDKVYAIERADEAELAYYANELAGAAALASVEAYVSEEAWSEDGEASNDDPDADALENAHADGRTLRNTNTNTTDGPTRTVTVTFEGQGSLGLSLIQDAGGRVLIESIIPNTLAAAMPSLQPGMILCTFQHAVAGESAVLVGRTRRPTVTAGSMQSVDGRSYHEVLSMLKAAPRPLQLRFEGTETEKECSLQMTATATATATVKVTGADFLKQRKQDRESQSAAAPSFVHVSIDESKKEHPASGIHVTPQVHVNPRPRRAQAQGQGPPVSTLVDERRRAGDGVDVHVLTADQVRRMMIDEEHDVVVVALEAQYKTDVQSVLDDLSAKSAAEIAEARETARQQAEAAEVAALKQTEEAEAVEQELMSTVDQLEQRLHKETEARANAEKQCVLTEEVRTTLQTEVTSWRKVEADAEAAIKEAEDARFKAASEGGKAVFGRAEVGAWLAAWTSDAARQPPERKANKTLALESPLLPQKPPAKTDSSPMARRDLTAGGVRHPVVRVSSSEAGVELRYWAAEATLRSVAEGAAVARKGLCDDGPGFDGHLSPLSASASPQLRNRKVGGAVCGAQSVAAWLASPSKAAAVTRSSVAVAAAATPGELTLSSRPSSPAPARTRITSTSGGSASPAGSASPGGGSPPAGSSRRDIAELQTASRRWRHVDAREAAATPPPPSAGAAAAAAGSSAGSNDEDHDGNGNGGEVHHARLDSFNSRLALLAPKLARDAELADYEDQDQDYDPDGINDESENDDEFNELIAALVTKGNDVMASSEYVSAVSSLASRSPMGFAVGGVVEDAVLNRGTTKIQSPAAILSASGSGIHAGVGTGRSKDGSQLITINPMNDLHSASSEGSSSSEGESETESETQSDEAAGSEAAATAAVVAAVAAATAAAATAAAVLTVRAADETAVILQLPLPAALAASAASAVADIDRKSSGDSLLDTSVELPATEPEGSNQRAERDAEEDEFNLPYESSLSSYDPTPAVAVDAGAATSARTVDDYEGDDDDHDDFGLRMPEDELAATNVPSVVAPLAERAANIDQQQQRARSMAAGKPPWKAAHDPASGCTYWFNRLTRETTWVQPPAEQIKPPPQQHQQQQAPVGFVAQPNPFARRQQEQLRRPRLGAC